MGKPVSDPRQRILDAGLKQFANRGYSGASVLDIVQDAKVTKPTLYYYFESKEGLFQALVNQALDERLRLMRDAATGEKETVDQLTDIIVAVTDFARRQPDVLRLCFSIAFAAPGEIPTGFKKYTKMGESYHFVRGIIESGLKRGALNASFSIDELTQAYFHLVQHATVLAVFESKVKHDMPPIPMPPRMAPRRLVELFLSGASGEKITLPQASSAPRKTSRLTKASLLFLGIGVLHTNAQVPATNQAPATTNALITPAPPPAVVAGVYTNYPAVTPPPPPVQDANTSPSLADVRPVPAAVTASHPELATVSPVAQNANNPHALDLQTCFQLTAVRDDSLKISMQDIYVARAQLSQSLAALWPSFSVNNQQEFLHYRQSNTTAISILGDSTVQGNRNYTSSSNVTMNYTVFNGGQNWNNLAASEAAVEAKKQTLSRNYQTIYQTVAQAFYNVLQFEGDMSIEADLIYGLKARVDDLHDRVKLGRSRPSELLQAQTDLANAKETYEQQRGSFNVAKETLAFYIGIPAGYFVLKDSQKFPTVEQLESYVVASGQRPDILSQVESLRQAERQLSSAKGQFLPTVSAQGDFLASQDPASNQIDATMNIQVSMPIFDGGLILGQINQNKALVRQNSLNVEQLRRTADQDTRTAYANFNASSAQVVVLREAAQLAAKNLEAQVDDYRKGVVSNLDVLTALQDYQSARQGLHDANMQARYNLINLNVMAGLAATGPGANNQGLPTSKSTTAR